MPELPEARRKRMIAEYEISRAGCADAYCDAGFADQFEAAAKAAKSPKRVANLVAERADQPAQAKRSGSGAVADHHEGHCARPPILPKKANFSSKQLKQLFDTAFENGEDFGVVYEREKPQQITDPSAIEKMIDEMIAANPKQVEQYRGGKKTVAAFFVGQVMKLSKGQANPALLNELVTKKLDS